MLDTFFELRPAPTATQRELLAAYYSARRDSGSDERITAATLREYAQSVGYETDIAVSVMQQLDDHYLRLRADKIKRDLESKK
jgi:hypothetical protein